MTEQQPPALEHPNKLVRLINHVFMCFREYFDCHADSRNYIDSRDLHSLLQLFYELGMYPGHLNTILTQLMDMYAYELDDDGSIDHSPVPDALCAIIHPYIEKPVDKLTKADVVKAIREINDYFSTPDAITPFAADEDGEDYDADYRFIFMEYISPVNHPNFSIFGNQGTRFMVMLNVLWSDVCDDILGFILTACSRSADAPFDFMSDDTPVPDHIQDGPSNYKKHSGFVDEEWINPFAVFPRWNSQTTTHDDLLRFFHAVCGICHNNGVVVQDYNHTSDDPLWPQINKIRIKGLSGVFSKKTIADFYALPIDHIRIPHPYFLDELEGAQNFCENHLKLVLLYLNTIKPAIGDTRYDHYFRSIITRAD